MQPANILHIKTLGEGWRDKDDILLHACFQLLTDFYEQEYLGIGQYLDWESDNEIKHAKEEMIVLYIWWQTRKKVDDYLVQTSEEEYASYLKDNEMLKRLIDIRMNLWA